MKKNTILTLVLLSEMFVLGCNPCGGPAGERRYYLLDIHREGQTFKHQEEVVLMVRPFSLAPGYHDRKLTYRTGEFQYESDYYNQFVTDVGQQVAEQTRTWLSQSGHFTHVVPPGSTLNATHILEGNITRLYGDFRDKSKSTGIVSIELFLLDVKARKPKVVFSKSYKATADIPEAMVENLIGAYNVCLKQILSTLESDLKNMVTVHGF